MTHSMKLNLFPYRKTCKGTHFLLDSFIESTANSCRTIKLHYHSRHATCLLTRWLASPQFRQPPSLNQHGPGSEKTESPLIRVGSPHPRQPLANHETGDRQFAHS